MHQLSPEVKTQWAFSFFRRTFFLTLFTFLFEIYVIQEYVREWFLGDYYLTYLVFAYNFLLIFIYPKLSYKYWKFEVRENELFIQRGIFTRTYTVAPFSRIQHLDVEESLFDRWLGLGKLVVYTAGTRGADLVIPGLPIDYAEQLRDYLKIQTSEDSV